MRLPMTALALLMLPATAHAAEPVTGQWLTANGNAIVTIAKCGSGVCGRITRIVKPDSTGGGTDRNNPDPALKTRKILGLEIIPAFTDAGKDWQGRLYNPESGGTYTGYLAKQPDGTLQVKGCVATFLCKTQKWVPAK